MKKKSVYYLILAAVAATLVGCNSGKDAEISIDPSTETIEEVAEGTENSELSEDVIAAVNDLYSVQINYSNGTAPLNIIPTTTVEAVYDNYDAIVEAGIKEAPISLREYVDPSIVYFDYDTDYSIKWNKDENDVTVEETNVEEREDYKQKEHRGW